MYDAQQGSTSGAHIDMSTASGTNNIHGTHTSIAEPTGSMPLPSSSIRTLTFPPSNKVPQLHRYILGGTFGGPIIKDKLFGFVAYQHLHVSDQEIGDSLLDVPVGLER